MISYVIGTIEEIETDAVILDHDGIGLRIFMPASSLSQNIRTGDEVKIHTFLNVKEDALQLYGFFSRDDLEIFRLLINVSGIGPKGAQGILSAMSADDLRFAVLADDAAAISKAPGIGKKTAQKLILELKDKFRLDDAFEKRFSHAEEMGMGTGTKAKISEGAEADAVQALVALGYSGTEALQAVRKADTDDSMDSEAILKAALKQIF